MRVDDSGTADIAASLEDLKELDVPVGPGLIVPFGNSWSQLSCTGRGSFHGACVARTDRRPILFFSNLGVLFMTGGNEHVDDPRAPGGRWELFGMPAAIFGFRRRLAGSSDRTGAATRQPMSCGLPDPRRPSDEPTPLLAAPARPLGRGIRRCSFIIGWFASGGDHPTTARPTRRWTDWADGQPVEEPLSARLRSAVGVRVLHIAGMSRAPRRGLSLRIGGVCCSSARSLASEVVTGMTGMAIANPRHHQLVELSKVRTRTGHHGAVAR